MSLWAITSYFNPTRSQNRLRNYRLFREHLSVPLVTVELSFTGEFELASDDADVMVQVSGGAVIWQKERLLNLALGSVPPDAKSVAWLDCDVILEDPDWQEAAQDLLDKFQVIQPFGDAVELPPGDPEEALLKRQDLPRDGRSVVKLVHSSGLSAMAPDNPEPELSRVTGKAWAARRRLLDKHGLYDALIQGGADRAILWAAYGHPERVRDYQALDEKRYLHYLAWSRPFHDEVQSSVGYIEQRLYHLWHGDLEDRQYRARHQALRDLGFDPSVDIKIGPSGSWIWARHRPDLEAHFSAYFANRRD